MPSSPPRWPLILAAILTIAAADPLIPPPFDEARQRPVIDQLDTKQSLAETYQLCPADVFRRDAPFWQRFLPKPASIPYQACEKDPARCVDQCFRRHSGPHCFALAQAFQYNRGPRTSPVTEMLYSMACAAGDGAGCVNRAAGIRNGGMSDDPFAARDPETKEQCEYRSFTIGCEGGDAWGCAMLGQSYGNGEGVAKDATQARRFYGRSCEINPNFVACDFAKKGLADLDPQPTR